MDWLEEFEKTLDSKLEAFLKENPYQKLLLTEETKKQEYQNLIHQENELIKKSENLRNDLLKLAEVIKEWKGRAERAKKARARNLTLRANQYLDQLTRKGRGLWEELENVGQEFKLLKRKIQYLSKREQTQKENVDQEWRELEIEEDLKELKNKTKDA